MTAAAPAGAAAESLAVGRHARTEIDLDGVGSASQPIELSLAAPFGGLLSAILMGRPYRVAKLSLEYVAPERLGSKVTFSARLSALRGAGEASLSLLVYRGSRLCVRGDASVLVEAPPAGSADHRINGKARSNGESR